MREFIVDNPDVDTRFAAVARELGQDKCTQLLQSTHKYSAAARAPSTFGFNA